VGDIILAPPRPSSGFYPETFAPIDVAKIRRELIEYHSGTLGVRMAASMAAIGRQNVLPAAASYEEAGRIICANEVARLRAASLYFITAETVALVGAAYDGYPDIPAQFVDPPSEAGFVLFGAPLLARPISAFDARRNHAKAQAVGIPTVGFDDPIYVVGAVWAPFAPDNWRGAAGYWVSFYAERGQMARYWDADALAAGMGVMPRITPENEVAWQCLPADGPARGKTERNYVLPDDRGGTASWGRALSCLWAMMRQEHIVQSDDVRMPKTERKRHTREGWSDPRDVVVVSYRRTVREEEAQVNAALAAGPPRRRGAGRDDGSSWYRVRFPVAAHWRNQWYPSEGVHRPKRIAATWKGPQDAPVKLRDRVNLF
jgi:hypothetical protein